MPRTRVDTLIIGGGQAGLAMSEHLGEEGVEHIILERNRIAESWRTLRWDSLVANGPVWHDRFPTKLFDNIDPDAFASKEEVTAYFEDFAKQIKAPIKCGVNVKKLEKDKSGAEFIAETSNGHYRAKNVVVATGAFHDPFIPSIIPQSAAVNQLHSKFYRNPGSLDEGAVLVVGAGSSGAQIAEELVQSGRKVYLSIGPHDKPPRSYRGKDFVWWLGQLGKWEAKTPPSGREHVTIAVSGAKGGRTIDFRRFAAQGITLMGMTRDFIKGELTFAPDLQDNIRLGDENYLSMLDEADAYIAKNALNFPEEPDARNMLPDPDCLVNPILKLDLEREGISTVLWATGYRQDFSWLKVDAFDAQGRPRHERGISSEPGVYFLGLPWLSMRGSSFIWGVWKDAKYLAQHISQKQTEALQYRQSGNSG